MKGGRREGGRDDEVDGMSGYARVCDGKGLALVKKAVRTRTRRRGRK
jgi:hypothetical protein